MVTSLTVGQQYMVGDGVQGYLGKKGLPPWMHFIDSTSKIARGNAQLPSGYHRITQTAVLLGLDHSQITTTDESVDIAPIQLPADNECPWRVAVFEPNGAYILADGLEGVPTIGTPEVRLTRSAPSRTVVQFALGKGKDNILSADFAGWSDGQTRAVARGMELTVEYRDADTENLVLVFRGRIFQIESGDTVTVTAYDRLMDLYQTTGQYLSHAGQVQDAKSQSRTESGNDWVYEMGVPLGILTNVVPINRVNINASGDTSYQAASENDIIIHPLPSDGGISVSAGDIISRIQTKVSTTNRAYTPSTPQTTTAIFGVAVTVKVYIYEAQGSAFVLRASGTAEIGGSGTATTGATPRTIIVDKKDQELDITLDNPVTVSDPSALYIGVSTSHRVTIAQHVGGALCYWGANKSTSQPTVSGTYYRSSDGVSWSADSSSSKPVLGLTFTHNGTAMSLSLATISGTTIVIAKGSLPAGPSGTYLSTEDAGVGIIASYYVADKAPLIDIVRELISAAGLEPNIGEGVNLGLVTFYTCITTDYLTVIRGLVEGRSCGIRDTVTDAGVIAVLPEHTVDETPVMSLSTDPTGSERIITSHNLTAHWAAERGTVAFIAENSTSSGLPLALETDDGLMDDSLIEALQSPLSSIQVDNTLGTHDMMAHSAGGAIRKLHTNTIEGTVVLAGYRLGLWDLSGSGVGGLPVSLDVPEYKAQGVAIPTEVVLSNGLTSVKLDNIRTQDRSGVANSMGLVEGTVSNDATLLPKTVYVFGKPDESHDNQIWADRTFYKLDSILLFRADGTVIGQTNQAYLRTVVDEAGYRHLLGVFPVDAGSWESVSPITTATAGISYSSSATNEQLIVACLDPPKYVIDNQNIHVDIRIRNQ